MNKKIVNRKYDKNTVIQLLEEGLKPKEIAERMDIGTSTVYRLVEKLGLNDKLKGFESQCEPFAKQIIEMINQGKGYHTIARELGLNRNALREWCRKNTVETKAKPNNDALDSELIESRAKEKGFEYLGGYENWQSKIKLGCPKCGTRFIRQAKILNTERFYCPKCWEEERESKHEKQEREKEMARKEREALKEIESERKKKNKAIQKLAKKISMIHECKTCGKRIVRNVYCSKECIKEANREKEREYWRINEIKRRAKIRGVLLDRDITVKKLYEKEKGICWICGTMTDLDDYVVTDKTVICGNNYPSVDHVIPLSLGGKHSWNNVHLAHRICNSYKGNKILDTPGTKKAHER